MYYLTERCFIYKITDSLCYIHLWLTIDTCLLLYFEKNAVFMKHLALFCYIYPPHLTGRSLKVAFDIKPVHSEKKKKLGER